MNPERMLAIILLLACIIYAVMILAWLGWFLGCAALIVLTVVAVLVFFKIIKP